MTVGKLMWTHARYYLAKDFNVSSLVDYTYAGVAPKGEISNGHNFVIKDKN